MMKRSLLFVVLSAALLSFILGLFGCSQPGETVAEGHRRHKRVLSIHQQQLTEDIDKALLIHEPSKLTERRIP
ncbi:MAG: hypothetical protein ACYTE8_13355 [Planctomycetota bacterium]|jgi:hypothetical protein